MRVHKYDVLWMIAVVLAPLAVALAGDGQKPAAPPLGPVTAEIAAGPFKPDWQSLQQYQCPEWFRDAKFGIWAHWTAQCVPEQGDWYARKMYIAADPKTGKPEADYTYHVEHYGHPSKFGFKDIDNLWHAEKWEPEKLIALYKKAGARYFVALANHHDNFDCYDSKYQPWNSLKVGPKKDIVGTWEKAARAAGLRFGVTVHASRAWSWFEPAQGSDPGGPLKGVPYDGKLTKADGKGTWWEGLDPQDLYAQNHQPGQKLEWKWDASKGSSIPDQAYCDKFHHRTVDLINTYRPDLLYFDDHVLPLYPISDVGLRIAAHYYNSSIQWHGRNEAVLNGKMLDEQQRKCMVYDIERGKASGVMPQPWQTDTCIGSWHYNRKTFEDHKYKTAAMVVPMLVDIVSKNGNLLLSIPVKGDGTIDADEVNVLRDMAAWIAVNGEGIYGSRPWKVYGEGPSVEEKPEPGRHGGTSDTRSKAYTAQDIRFTSKGDTLYAFCLALPTTDVRIASLGKQSEVSSTALTSVELLGSNERLDWKQEADALVIKRPGKMPCQHALAFRIALAKPGTQTSQPAGDGRQASAREPDVVYVPTPQKVVDKMLEMAEIKKGDVVYDLGCGDGRIVVTAAKKYGVKAVGFDINPERIKESLANVKANKVEHLVTIKQADIFTLDLREATVVTLYLLPGLNVKLMPQLEKLKPGSRIVSHDFDMRGAKPVQVHSMTAENGEFQEDEYGQAAHTIYKWIVPWEKEPAIDQQRF